MPTADPASATPTEIDVFVSHSSLDDATVNRIHDALTAAGLNTWVDHRDIRADQRWSDEVQKALDGCKSALYVFSANSQDSAECQYEWEYILKRGISLMVAVIDPTPTKNIHYRIETKQRTSLSKDFDAGIAEIVRAIKGVPPAAPTTSAGRKFTGTIAPEHRDWDLIGRDDDLTAIRNWFASDDKPVAILGLGGVGKTRLAAEIARNSDFPAGVIWLRIDSSTTLDSLTDQIRRHFFGIQPAEADTIWDRLRSEKALVVLDNAEDCTQPVAFADRINSLRGSSARVLITARNLGIWDKLGHPHKCDLIAPTTDQALRILIEMAQIKEPAFWDVKYASEIVEAARKHPRLMEKALDWLNNFDALKVLDTLRTLKGRDAEQLLDDMILKTVEQAKAQDDGEDAIALLRKLAVCRGGFTLAAAEAIGGEDEVRDSLPLLRRWGLVTVQNQRYDIDPLLIAAEREDKSAHEKHFLFYEILARKADEKQDYLGLDVESLNLETAFEWLFAQKRYEEAYWFSNFCANFQLNRGRFEQNLNWIRRLKAQISDEHDSLIPHLYVSLGNTYWIYPFGNRSQNLQLAINNYHKALLFWTPNSAALEYAQTRSNLGSAYSALADIFDPTINIQQAIDNYQEALHYLTPNNSAMDYAMTLSNLGSAYDKLADIQDPATNLQFAVNNFYEVLRFWTPESAPLYYAGTHYNLGNTHFSLANVQDFTTNLKLALNSYREALRFFTSDSAPLEYAMTQRNLGNALKASDDIPAALYCWCEAAKYYRKMQRNDRAQRVEQWIADAGGKCDDPA